MAKYSIGLDFGTLSVRALLLDIHSGEEIGVSVYNYPHGIITKKTASDINISSEMALQHPEDYINGLIYTVTDIIKKTRVCATDIVGIGVGFTASTILPVTNEGIPLCYFPEFKNNPHSYVKLWKHHSAEKEARHIEKIAKQRKEKWLPLCGNKISSELLLPKVLETLKKAPTVYSAADRYIEAMDWIVWQLTGKESRSINALKYKAFFNQKKGWITSDFLKAVDPQLEDFVTNKLYAPVKEVGETAGGLSEEMAVKLGLVSGIPVGTPIIDAHACILGSGITKPMEMIMIAGTSFCHYTFGNETEVNGICSVISDGILPGYTAFEAGQSGGGDHFEWFAKNCIPWSYEQEAKENKISVYKLLAEKLSNYHVGESGLIALDWFNGVRSPYIDFDLSGLILGLNLQTKPEEIYLSLIEATAYGTKRIVEEFEVSGLKIKDVCFCGGIPLKDAFFVQVFADVLGREIKVISSKQSGARGAAILGVSAASNQVSGYNNLTEIVEKLGNKCGKIYTPNMDNTIAYNKLYKEYIILCEYFAKQNSIMKKIKNSKF